MKIADCIHSCGAARIDDNRSCLVFDNGRPGDFHVGLEPAKIVCRAQVYAIGIKIDQALSGLNCLGLQTSFCNLVGLIQRDDMVVDQLCPSSEHSAQLAA
jgi:hypothetical protein